MRRNINYKISILILFFTAEILFAQANLSFVRVSPKTKISQDSDETSRQIEQDGLNIKYQEELWCHWDKKNELKRGINRAYALIFINYCTRSMHNRVEQHPEFRSTIKNDAKITNEWHNLRTISSNQHYRCTF